MVQGRTSYSGEAHFIFLQVSEGNFDSGLNCTISYYITMSDDNHRHFIGAWVNFTLGATYYVVLLNINCDLLRLRSFFMDQL